MHTGQLPLDIDTQQVLRFPANETTAEQAKERHQLPAQPPNL
jgi:hypothetical protein